VQRVGIAEAAWSIGFKSIPAPHSFEVCKRGFGASTRKSGFLLASNARSQGSMRDTSKVAAGADTSEPSLDAKEIVVPDSQ
jgi:hypothetical protein